MERREALEYLVGLGMEKEPIVELAQGTYTRESLKRVTAPLAEVLRVSTLTGLVDYIKANVDQIRGELLIHVNAHNEVRLYSPLNCDRERELYISNFT